jgi:hypothetical protein
MISLKILKFLYFLITFTVWLVAYNNGIYCINEHGLYTKRFLFRKFGIKFDSVNSDKISLRKILDEKLEKHRDEFKKNETFKDR